MRIWFLAIAAAALISAGHARAQDYPNRQVRMITGSPPGGGGDFLTRLTAQGLTTLWGQPVVVENMPGASQSLAASTVAHAAPDGYTLTFVSSSVMATALNPKASYSFEKDLVPVDLVAIGPVLLVVNPSLPVHSVQDLIDLARTEPGKLNYATGGVGTSAHITGELFNQLAHVQMVHVPYAGTERGVIATQSGETQLAFPGFGGTIQLFSAGKLRPIAVAGAKRSTLMPSLPTINETLPGFDEADWYGVLAPRNTPKELLEKIHAAVLKVGNDPEVVKKFSTLGFEPQQLSSDEWAAKMHNDFDRYVKLANSIGLKP